MAESEDVQRLLLRWAQGDASALDELLPLVYAELRRIATRQLRRDRPDHTLAPTALVHELYLRLIQQRHPSWQNRAHFYGVAAQLMRRILVDYARARGASTMRAAAGSRVASRRSASSIARTSASGRASAGSSPLFCGVDDQ